MVIEMVFDLYKPEQGEKKDLPPVILIHCIGETKETWREVGPMIAKGTGRNVYAVDLRNHGSSPWNDEYGTDILVKDLDHFTIQHQIPTAIVLGHSMGGAVAMRFALKKPTKVEKLIIEDTPAKKIGNVSSHLISSGLTGLKRFENAVKRFADEKSAREALRKYFLDIAPMFHIQKERILEDGLDLIPFKWNGKYLELNLNYDIIKKYIREKNLTRPCSGVYEGEALFLYGTLSKAGVQQDDSIKKYFPRAIKKPFLENLGHFLHHVDSGKFAEEVITFINNSSRMQSKY